jgi:hypothetical protein
MKELIKEILKEQKENKTTEMLDNLVLHIENTHPNVKLTYKLNGDKVNFSVDTTDNNSSGVYFNKIRNLIWDETNRSGLITTINPSKNLINKFYNTSYIKNLLPTLKQENLNPRNFFLDFDGEKNWYLDELLDKKSKVKGKDIQDKIIKFIESKTDVPLNIEIDTNHPNTVNLNIRPQMTIEDFKNCRYKQWFLNPNNPDSFKHEISKILTNNNIKDIYHIFYEINWPREIGSLITEKNKELRDLLPKTFGRDTSVAIEYGTCLSNPTFLIGRSNDGPFNQYRNDRDKVNKVIKKLYPNEGEILTTTSYWDVKNKYNPENTKYWTKEKLFNYFVEQSKNVHGDIYEYNIDKFNDLETLTEVYCKQHQRWFEVLPKEHIGGKRCPFDNESKGESMVRVYLEKNKIPFMQYHKLKGCFSEINGRCILLTFDFFLPEQNTVIEYDGEQHYRPVERFGGEETYKRQVILDSIKNVFCNKSNIKMIRIPYTIKKPKDVQELLDLQLGRE